MSILFMAAVLLCAAATEVRANTEKYLASALELGEESLVSTKLNI